MGMRIHTADAANLNLSVLSPAQFDEVYGGWLLHAGDSGFTTDVLVIEDGGNQEALVITGTHDDIAQLVADLVWVTLRGPNQFGTFADDLAKVLATESEQSRSRFAIELHGRLERAIADHTPGAEAAMDELLTKVFKMSPGAWKS